MPRRRRPSRRGSEWLEKFIAVFLALGFLAVIIIGFSYQVVSAPPEPPGTPLGQLQSNPVIRWIGEPIRQVLEQVGGALQAQASLQTAQGGAMVGLGAIIGYTSSSGESITYQTNQPYMMSGVSLLYAGIHVKPDKPGYKALKLYDEETGADGEVWYQPYLSIAVMSGTPESFRIKVEPKAVLRCDDRTFEILEYASEERSGIGRPPARIDFGKLSVKGSKIYSKLKPAMARGASSCILQLAADYEGEIKFEEDEEPVRKTLTNVILGTFELRRMTPKGDFQFSISSNATIRPLAEIMVGGEGGIGTTQTITYTETKYIVTAQAGQTVTVTQTQVRTRTVEIRTTVTREIQTERTVTVTKTVTVVRGAYPMESGVLIVDPYDAFVFIGGGRR